MPDESTPPQAFSDVPWWARPSYVKAMGMAIIAVVTGFLLALYQFGLLGGGDEDAPVVDPEAVEQMDDELPDDELPDDEDELPDDEDEFADDE